MAVGKGSMARASKAADNTSVSKETKRTTAKTTAKTKAVTASKVISGTFGVGDAMPIYFF